MSRLLSETVPGSEFVVSERVTRRDAIRRVINVTAGAALCGSCFTSASSRASDSESGIRRVTRDDADLIVRRDGEGFRYGTGYVFQAGPTQAGLLCNLRTEGYRVGDFEASVDALVFDDLKAIAANKAVPVTRTVRYADRQTGQPRIVIKHGSKGAFVPWGALRDDGTPHPHAGTGFAFCEALDFPMKSDGSYDKRDKTRGMVRLTELQQLRFDGQDFRCPRIDTWTDANPLQAPGSKWKITCPPLRMGIPDGDDLLLAVAATSNDASTWFSDPHAAGISRWQFQADGWRPTEFIPIVYSRQPKQTQVVYGQRMSVPPIEPSLVRDTDGSLVRLS